LQEFVILNVTEGGVKRPAYLLLQTGAKRGSTNTNAANF
jgi:hypothetical protein